MIVLEGEGSKIIELISITLLFVIILSAAHFIHELGHLLAAKLCRIKKLVLVLGRGPTVCKLRTANTRVEINVLFFLGGYTTTDLQKKTPYWKQSLIAVSGPLFNLLIVFFLLILLQVGQSAFFADAITPIIAVNLWVGVVNLLPFKVAEKESDGWSFIKNTILAVRSA